MSDEVKAAETAEPVEKSIPSVDDLIKEIEQIKRAQAGSDKAYQETAKQKSALEAELEKIKKERMSEKEKAEYELAQKQAALEAKEREVAEATLRFSKMRLLGEKSVPLEFAEYIHGANEDEVSKNIDTFLKHFNEAVRKGVDEKLKGAKAPEAGKPTEGKENFDGKNLQDIEAQIRASLKA